jgi:hypothetical protein
MIAAARFTRLAPDVERLVTAVERVGAFLVGTVLMAAGLIVVALIIMVVSRRVLS